MAKVITYSRTFPTYHPKARQSTYFVEKFWKGILICQSNIDNILTPISEYIYDVGPKLGYEYADAAINAIEALDPKYNTIRAGNRWKVGDWFSPRIWSGKPRISKQIIIAPDIQIKNIWTFESTGNNAIYINDKSIDWSDLDLLAKNDGLNREDLLAWFKYPKPFKGQIICWNDKINY